MEEKIKLEVDHGAAKAGTVFVRGLHGVPTYPEYREKMNNPNEWYWREGTKAEDNAFLHKSWIINAEGKQLFAPPNK